MKRRQQIRTALAVLVSLFLVACGGNGGGQTNDISAATGAGFSDNSAIALKAVTSASIETRQKLLDHMRDRYLWYPTLPNIDIADEKYADLRTLLKDLRKQPEDRFSSLANTYVQDQRIDQGVTGTYGFRFAKRENPSTQDAETIDLRIAGVDDFGTVAAAGIQRGDRVIGAGGKTIDELGYQGFRDLFSGSGLGEERTLQIRHPDGREQSYTVSRTEHSLNPVRKATVFTSPDTGRRVGYVLVDEFIRLTSDQLEPFRENFSNIGLDDLIIDLRYNSGGLVFSSRDLASSIYGQGQSGDVYVTLQRNNKYSQFDYTYEYRDYDNAFTNLNRVFVLTTGATCSASEYVINGLRPFMEVITVGSATCGKPYAARAFEVIPELVDANILESRSVNALGEGEFFEGFSPVCEAIDDPVLPFDDPRESLVSVALYYTENGRCPPVAEPSATLGMGIVDGINGVGGDEVMFGHQ